MLFAQNNASPFGKKINNLEFDGLVNVSDGDANSVVKDFKGKELTEELVYDLQEALLSSGYFLSIGDIYVKEGAQTTTSVVLTIVVDKEKPIIKSVKYKGNKKLKAGDLTGKTNLKKGSPFDTNILSTAKAAIQEAYLAKGYLQVKVSAEYEETEKNGINVVFNVEEGLPEIVREIKFIGVDRLVSGKENRDNEVLMKKTAITQKIRTITNKGYYQEELIAEDSQRVEMFYRNYGFMDAKVERVYPERAVSEADKAVYITLVYVINEGEQWLFGGLSIYGNNVFGDSELYPYFNIDYQTGENLKDVAGLNLDETFNYSKFMSAYANGLQNAYGAQGFIFNQYDAKERRVGNKIYYDIQINEFDRAHVNSISITGNKKTKPHVIRREIGLEEGDVYSQAKMTSAYNNLMSTGFFDSVTPSIERTEAGSIPGLVDVGVNVTEARTIQLQFGVSVTGTTDDNEFPVSLVMSFGDTNFLGYGYNFKGSLTLNTDEQQVGISFYNPRVNGSRFGFGGSFNYRHSNDLIPQDIMYPINTEEDIPDPFTGGYVYGGGDNAGEYWVGDPPTEQEIEDNNLVRDYDYFIYDDQYAFEYNSHEFWFGINTGYTYKLPKVPGFLRFNAGFNLGWEYVTYDSDLYRPAYAETREGLDKWTFNDGLSLKLSWDARDNPQMPLKGFILSEEVYFSGGFLGGNRTYMMNKTRLDWYIPLPAIKFSQKEDAWAMKFNLKFRTAFHSVTNQFGYEMKDAEDYYPVLDGMFVGRGWADMEPEGQFLWENTFELRMPLIQTIFWWDVYFLDINMLWRNQEDLADYDNWYNNLYGAMGTGFRIAIPSLPIAVYLIKRFKVNSDGSIDWNPGYAPLFPKAGLDIAITFQMDMY